MIDRLPTDDEIRYLAVLGPVALVFVVHIVYRIQQRWFHRKSTKFVGKYAPAYRVIKGRGQGVK